MDTAKTKILNFLYSFSILSEYGNYNRSNLTNRSLFPLITGIFISNIIMIFPTILFYFMNGFNYFNLVSFFILFLIPWFFGFFISYKLKKELNYHRKYRLINSKFLTLMLLFLSFVFNIFINLICKWITA